MSKFTIAHTGDIHACSTTIDKAVAFLDYFFAECLDRQVAAIMLTGDIYNSSVMVGDGTFNELVKALRKAPAPVYIIEGTKQHDRPGSIDIFNSLANYWPIRTFREPGSFPLYLASDKLMMEEDRYPDDAPDIPDAWLSVLPTPTRAWLAAQHDLSLREIGDKLQQYMADIFAGFGARATAKPHILLSHIEVAGSESSTGQVMGSGDVRVSSADILRAMPTVTLLGHIHKAQQPTLENLNIFYSGSPYPLNFGELEPKGFRTFTFEDGKLLSHEFVPTPLSIARPIQVIRIEPQNGQFVWDAEPLEGVDLRLKVYAPRDWFTDELMTALENHCNGKVNSLVISKFPQPESRIRAANMPHMQTLDDELKEWGQVKNVEVTDTALAKLAAVEREVAL